MANSTELTSQSGLKIAHVEAPATEENERRTRSGKFTLGQLRQTDGLVPLQSGTNQFDSQKVSLLVRIVNLLIKIAQISLIFIRFKLK
ncbi:unnamed protein product [Onchocerca flexuosa]|uniref:Uncharacterized protein n=1 Tax=Onchocerca flexuosa TaxID=387005 RepID=A0A183H318_9BILA|nr:unnamed protein product [Onchocerca flexuosa]